MPARRRRPIARLIGAALPLLLVLGGIWLGGHPGYLPGFLADGLTEGRDIRAIDEAIERIQDDYYRPVSRDRLVDTSIAGMVRGLRDQFSAYLSPSEYQAFQNVTNGEFSGVGMQVISDRRGLRVVEVYDDSPAKRAGIRPGDVVVAANGRSLAGRSEEASTALIKGPPGTEVVLTIRRGQRTRRERVTRATVSVPVVASGFHRVGGKRLGHIVLARFSSGAHGELRAAVKRVVGRHARGIVLDLRHNGGGLLEEARLVASVFIAEGPIVSTRGRNQPERTLMATGGALAPKIPIVVLVDRTTASAAEIVAGALRDRGRAVAMVGTRTFGKGIFQEVGRLSNGGALEITAGQYFTPSGRNLGGGGVRRGAGLRPDITARDRSATARDEALAIALHTLAARAG